MRPLNAAVVTTTLAFINTDDGLIVIFQARRGYHGIYQWRVYSRKDALGWQVQEEATFTGFALLMPCILREEKNTRSERLALISLELEEADKGETENLFTDDGKAFAGTV
jgi:hypothetical protein